MQRTVLNTLLQGLRSDVNLAATVLAIPCCLRNSNGCRHSRLTLSPLLILMHQGKNTLLASSMSAGNTSHNRRYIKLLFLPSWVLTAGERDRDVSTSAAAVMSVVSSATSTVCLSSTGLELWLLLTKSIYKSSQ